MTRTAHFRRLARRELDEAADWYNDREAGLGAELVAAVHSVINEIVVNPFRYTKVWKEVREGLVPGFPYCVYYFEEGRRIIVLSVFHTSRDPQIRQSRQ